MTEQKKVTALYKKLLSLYPQGFRDAFGESMQQTFNDLYEERQAEHGLPGFVFWMFFETGAGILHEHILLLTQGNAVKNMISNPTSAAITSFILSLPLGLIFFRIYV